MRPITACAMVVVERTRVSQVTPESPGIPRAMVLTVSFALSPVTGLSCHHHSRKLLLANLTPASGCQDHTTSPSASAPFVIGASASTASRPASVTIAKRPSDRDGTTVDIDLTWVRREAEYFCKEGWTPRSTNCPSCTGKNGSSDWKGTETAAEGGNFCPERAQNELNAVHDGCQSALRKSECCHHAGDEAL